MYFKKKIPGPTGKLLKSNKAWNLTDIRTYYSAIATERI